MNNNKVVVKKAPEGKKKLPAIKESIQKCPSKMIIIIKGEKCHEIHSQYNSHTVSCAVSIFIGKRESNAMACSVRSKSYCRSYIRQSLLRVCLPNEYSDDSHRVAV